MIRLENSSAYCWDVGYLGFALNIIEQFSVVAAILTNQGTWGSRGACLTHHGR